jgi:glycosyltransferase involved in cell wall biosynthesis
MITEHCFKGRIHLLPPRTDVTFYYALADAYADLSLEDTIAFPPVEAMSCDLPVIVSSQDGTFKTITDGTDGLILSKRLDSRRFTAKILRLLYENGAYRDQLGRNAAKTALQFTCEHNGRELTATFKGILRRKPGPPGQPLVQELDA